MTPETKDSIAAIAVILSFVRARCYYDIVEQKRFTRKKLGIHQQKLLLLLAGGLVLGLSRNPNQYFKVVRGIKAGLKELDRRQLHDAIRGLYESKLVHAHENEDGTITITVTKDGTRRSLQYDPDAITIKKPLRWDGKWRVVLFDIPERLKPARDALREALRSAGCLEYQKSVFVHPYAFQDELEFLLEHYEVKPFVRTMLVESMDNELHLKEHFALL